MGSTSHAGSPAAVLRWAGVATAAILAMLGSAMWPSGVGVLLAGAAMAAAVWMAWSVLSVATRARMAGAGLALGGAAVAALFMGCDPALWTARGLALGGWVWAVLGAGCGGYALLGRWPERPAPADETGMERPEAFRQGERLSLSLGLGLFALSMGSLGLGLAGWMNPWTAALLPAVGWGVAAWSRGAGNFVAAALRFARDACRVAADWRPVTAALAVTALAGALLPAAAATLPPTAYDVVEYHAQLPREYHDLGQIRFLAHNAFSGFPQTMEMLSYWSFGLLGRAADAGDAALSRGLWLAQLLHWTFLPLLLAGVVLAGGRLARSVTASAEGAAAGAWWGGAVAMATVGTQLMSTIQQLYVEIGLAAFGLLALLAVLKAGDGGGRCFWGWLVVAGGLAGAAAGCKYTALVFVGAPLCVAVLAGVAGGGGRRRLGGAVLVGVVCWAVFAPWLVKNAATTGNPFYPLANDYFGVADWSEAQTRRMTVSHASDDFRYERFVAEVQRIVLGGMVRYDGPDGKPATVSGMELGVLGWVLLPGLLAFVLGRSGGTGWGKTPGVALWLAWMVLAWFFFTHRMERFFHFGQMLACTLSAAGWCGIFLPAGTAGGARSGRWGVGIGLALSAWVFAVWLDMAVFLAGMPLNPREDAATTAGRVAAGAARAEDWVSAGYGPARLRTWLRARVGPRSSAIHPKVLLVGAADPFWLPSGRYGYAVVFSRHPLFERLAAGASAEAVADGLAAGGYTHLYINWSELGRLNASPTYGAPYALDAAAGRQFARLLSRVARRMPEFDPAPAPLRELARSGTSPWLARLALDYPALFAEADRSRAAVAVHELYALPGRGGVD